MKVKQGGRQNEENQTSSLHWATLVVFCCGYASPGHWYRPDMTQDQFRVDSYECERDARMVPKEDLIRGLCSHSKSFMKNVFALKGLSGLRTKDRCG